MENSHRLKDDYLLPYNANGSSDVIHVTEEIESISNSQEIVAMETRLRELSELYHKQVVVHVICNDFTYMVLKRLITDNKNLQLERDEVLA